MALLGQRMETLLSQQERMLSKLDDFQVGAHERELRISILEKTAERLESHDHEQDERIDVIKARSDRNDGILGFAGAVIAAVLTYLGVSGR